MEKTRHIPTVVVTGMGVVSALGNDADTFFGNLVAGRSGIKRVTRVKADDFPSKVAGEVTDFDPNAYIDPKVSKRCDRFTQFGIAATRIAMQHAGLQTGGFDPDRLGIVLGTGIGGMETIEDQTYRLFQGGPRKISPFMIPMLIANMGSGMAAIEIGARGPNYCIISACSTGAHAIGDALRILQLGEAEVMVAGGTEAAITQMGFGGFCNMKAMSTNRNDDPERASRPFDVTRDGFVMGEGAGVLVLETLEHARRRGATIYAELCGQAASCDAYHMTAPDPEGYGLSVCMRNALERAGLQPSDVDYINAHGTSTPYNDKTETASIKTVFGEHARKVKISSTKSMTGHLLGAAGGIEAIACVQAIAKGQIPPTINYEQPDPVCDLDYVPNKAIEMPVRVALTNNLGFGGHNATLIFKALEA